MMMLNAPFRFAAVTRVDAGVRSTARGEQEMLGWEILVYRKRTAATSGSQDVPLARWSTGLGGLAWLKDLVAANRAVDLGGNGYPSRYAVSAGVLESVLASGRSSPDGPEVFAENGALHAGARGGLGPDRAAFLSACGPDEPLVIEAWDQS